LSYLVSYFKRDFYVLTLRRPLNVTIFMVYRRFFLNHNVGSGILCTLKQKPNKKLSYRRETARQLPTWMEVRVSPPPLWLYLCIWSNPKATTYVRQAHF